MKPLFIPLKTEFYEAFLSGEKNTEFRLYGARWNENTCVIGRRVILSKGYGKKNRMMGTVMAFDVSLAATDRPEWKEIYGEKGPAACILIDVELPQPVSVA